ncbi:MAG: hypothetical protein QXH07_04980 [Thermoplasmata archaeon]
MFALSLYTAVNVFDRSDVMKGISVYLDANELAFLNKKVSEGYKVSSLVRHIISEWIKKEGNKNTAK